MRSVAIAIESYHVDRNRYPYTLGFALDNDGYGMTRAGDMLTIPDQLTTPIGYLTSHLPDVFKIGRKVSVAGGSGSAGRPYESGDPQDTTFLWLNMAQAGPGPGDPGLGFGFFFSAAVWQAHFDQWGWWQMRSMGPTGLYPGEAPGYLGASFMSINALYDPTNGTVSTGMIIRNQRSSEGKQSG